ncbi:MAG: hypothetical protein ACHQ49_14940 [Elusimicrobiota bacterium]
MKDAELKAGPWHERRYRLILCGLVLVAAVTRGALIWGAPRPFGYVWDLYHESVVWTYEHGRLPRAGDCGECYHPPLFIAPGVPLYALGAAASNGGAARGLRLLALFSMVCGGFVAYYCHETLRLLKPSRGSLLLGTSLALVFPCLFIGSYAAENDALLAALMAAFFYRLMIYYLHPARSGWKDPVLIGLLAGLSALTKYSGLVALIVAAAVLGPSILFGSRRLRAARGLLVIFAVAAAVSGWHYARNMTTDHKPFLGPPWARDVFSVDAAKVSRNRSRYNFHSFKIDDVLDLYRPEKVGTLDEFPIYRSVFTTLHALAWTDMSFFSVPGRHGWKLPLGYGEAGADMPMVAQTPANAARIDVYPAKRIQLWLVDLVLHLATIPSVLACIGFAATLRRRALRPFVAFTGVSLAVYFWWVLAQPAWALKTKYILFLLPAYVVYMIMGLRAVARVDRRLGFATAAGLIAALVASEAYLWMFALG